MNTRLTVDKAGRIVLPKPVRDELQLSPGDMLELDSEGEQIVLRPVRDTTPLRKERGMWVFRTGQPLAAVTVNSALRQSREERESRSLGKSR